MLLTHAAATLVLVGLIWVVQVVVYPSFLAIGESEAWPAAHAEHERRISWVVAPPWAVQGVTTAVLLLQDDQPRWLLWPDALLAASTVALTVFVSVPLHRRLAVWDHPAAVRLVRTNWLRTAAWTGSAGLSLVMLAR